MRIRIVLTTLALFLTPLTGCSQLTEFATGECSGGKTAVLPDNSPTLAAHAAFRLDQVATTLDQALERCDELGIATFASTPSEVDLKGLSTVVEGRNAATRSKNRAKTVAQLVDRVDTQLNDTLESSSGSDVVAALRFALSTYIGDERDGSRIVLVTDGLATRPDLAGPATVGDPEGAVAALRAAGLDSIDLTGVVVEIVGIGHSDEANPLPRDLVDALGDVWEQALARSGATVEIREALPNSAGKADASRASADGTASSETSEDVRTAPGVPTPGGSTPFGVPAAIGAAVLPFRRRRGTDDDDESGPAGPFIPPTADQISATGVAVAGDPTMGSPAAAVHETAAINHLALVQRARQAFRLAGRTRRTLGRVAARLLSATTQLQRAVADLVGMDRSDLDLWAARLVVGGRTHRHLSRRAAVTVEVAIATFDIWALGGAIAKGADASVLDGLLLAGGGGIGMVLTARLLGSKVAHAIDARKVPTDDPARRYWPGVFDELEATRAVKIAGGVLAGLLGLTAIQVGLVRSDGAGWDLATLMTGLTLFTLVGTMAVEVLSVNVLADQEHTHVKAAADAARKANRSVSKHASRDLRFVREMATRVTAHGEQTVSNVEGLYGRAGAIDSVRQGTHVFMTGAVGTPAEASTPSTSSTSADRSEAIDHHPLPHEGIRLGADRVGAFLSALAGATDTAIADEVRRESTRHRITLVQRLRAAGIEVADDATVTATTAEPSTRHLIDLTPKAAPASPDDVVAEDEPANDEAASA